MGLRVEGASLSNPVGFSPVEAELLAMVASVAAILLPILILLRLTRLRTDDLRLLLPAPLEPGFLYQSCFWGLRMPATCSAGCSGICWGATAPLFPCRPAVQRWQ